MMGAMVNSTNCCKSPPSSVIRICASLSNANGRLSGRVTFLDDSTLRLVRGGFGNDVEFEMFAAAEAVDSVVTRADDSGPIGSWAAAEQGVFPGLDILVGAWSGGDEKPWVRGFSLMCEFVGLLAEDWSEEIAVGNKAPGIGVDIEELPVMAGA